MWLLSGGCARSGKLTYSHVVAATKQGVLVVLFQRTRELRPCLVASSEPSRETVSVVYGNLQDISMYSASVARCTTT